MRFINNSTIAPTIYGSNYLYYILGRLHTAVLLISCEHITTLGMVHTGSYVLSDKIKFCRAIFICKIQF